MALDFSRLFTRYLIAPAWARWERSPYLRHFRQLQETQFDPPEAIRKRQLDQLQTMLQHAYETTAFYRERFDSVGFSPKEFLEAEALSRIPLLTKSDLRQSQAEMMSRQYATESLHRKKTSGSTGTSVEVWVDEAAQQFKRACTVRSDQWSGWRFGESVAMVWGNPEYLNRGWRGRLRNYLLERATYLDTLKMDEQAMLRFCDALRKRPPSLMFGHAHSLFLFACFVRQQSVSDIRPRGIISTAMVLLESERNIIEEVFACPVTNRYGCEEVSLIACECEEHRGLHVNAEGIFVEVLREDGTPADFGEIGRVVVTDLVNRAMPILRYQVGDMAALSARRCACGRGLPLLERIEGRTADFVVMRDGSQVSGISLTENFAMLVPGIAQLQVVQEAIDDFLFRIVKGPNFDEHSEAKIKELVFERFGHEAKYQIEFVTGIPQESSGKYRFCISKVDNPLTVAN